MPLLESYVSLTTDLWRTQNKKIYSARHSKHTCPQNWNV